MNTKIYRAKTKNGELVEGNLIISKEVEEGFEAIIIPVNALDSGMFTDNHVFSEKNKQEYLCFETWHKVDINTVEEVNRNKGIVIDSESEYQKLAEMFGAKLITIEPNNFTKIEPFEIEIEEKYSRQDILSRIKDLVVIANKGGEMVSAELIKKLAYKNNFEITDDEIYGILNS